jgi:hypothetical protein
MAEVPEETVPGEADTDTSVQVTIDPSAFAAPSLAMHHVTVVLAPFAVTEALSVAAEPLIEVAAFVVAEGAEAEIVIENVDEAVEFAESVTRIVIPVVVPVVVGVPVIDPEVLIDKPAGRDPEVIAHEE